MLNSSVVRVNQHPAAQVNRRLFTTPQLAAGERKQRSSVMNLAKMVLIVMPDDT